MTSPSQKWIKREAGRVPNSQLDRVESVGRTPSKTAWIDGLLHARALAYGVFGSRLAHAVVSRLELQQFLDQDSFLMRQRWLRVRNIE